MQKKVRKGKIFLTTVVMIFVVFFCFGIGQIQETVQTNGEADRGEFHVHFDQEGRGQLQSQGFQAGRFHIPLQKI